jgi:hypothetical protein
MLEDSAFSPSSCWCAAASGIFFEGNTRHRQGSPSFWRPCSGASSGKIMSAELIIMVIVVVALLGIAIW